jgi:hypothetical protein
MKKPVIIAAIAAAIVSTSGAAFAKPVDVEFTNQSKWTIEHLFMSPTSENKWGPDQLEDKVVKKGESFTLKGVPAGKYDIKLIDEDADECVVANLKVADHGSIKITDQNLLDCQDDTEAAEEEGEDDEE